MKTAVSEAKNLESLGFWVRTSEVLSAYEYRMMPRARQLSGLLHPRFQPQHHKEKKALVTVSMNPRHSTSC